MLTCVHPVLVQAHGTIARGLLMQFDFIVVMEHADGSAADATADASVAIDRHLVAKAGSPYHDTRTPATRGAPVNAPSGRRAGAHGTDADAVQNTATGARRGRRVAATRAEADAQHAAQGAQPGRRVAAMSANSGKVPAVQHGHATMGTSSYASSAWAAALGWNVTLFDSHARDSSHASQPYLHEWIPMVDGQTLGRSVVSLLSL